MASAINTSTEETKSLKGLASQISSKLLLVMLVGLVAFSIYGFVNSNSVSRPYTNLDRNTFGKVATDALAALSPEQRELLRVDTIEALKQEPLDSFALKTLTRLYGVANDKDKQHAYMLAAASRSYRDVEMQLEAINLHLANRRFADATRHMDGLLRAKPELGDVIFAPFHTFADTPETSAALASVLVSNPPWRFKFLKNLFDNDAKGDRSNAMISAIRKAGTGVSTDELREFLVNRIKNGQFDLAYLVQLDQLPENELALARNVFDGGFSVEPKNLPFSWNLGTARNVKVQIAPRPGSSGDRMLQLDVFGLQRRVDLVYQFLRLQPGKHVLSGEMKGEQIQNEAGFAWAVLCVETGVAITRSDVLVQSLPWTAFTSSFDVPAEQCNTQQLVLKFADEKSSDKVITGQYYYDNLSITPGSVEE